jgi:hypothetical protein
VTPTRLCWHVLCNTLTVSDHIHYWNCCFYMTVLVPGSCQANHRETVGHFKELEMSIRKSHTEKHTGNVQPSNQLRIFVWLVSIIHLNMETGQSTQTINFILLWTRPHHRNGSHHRVQPQPISFHLFPICQQQQSSGLNHIMSYDGPV